MDAIHAWLRPAACMALLAGLLVAPGAGAETGIAPSGPCAAAADRDPCDGGSCSRHGAKVRGRFSPASVASDSTGDSSDAPPPPSFEGPGSCVDPSTGCGDPTVVSLRRSDVGSEGPGPAPFVPAAPLPNETPAPPTPPAPVVAGGPPSPPTPPTPNPSIDPPAPAAPPPAPPAPPSAPQTTKASPRLPTAPRPRGSMHAYDSPKP